jgi:hypothetical protein
MTEPASGWAVTRRGVIQLDTVSSTRRGAIVNAVVREGALVLRTHTDDDIEGLWSMLVHARRNDGFEAIVVEVTAAGIAQR